jgi:beta-glucosidase/6-phospho-beta-glucosidase/beta-galactosidase
MKAILEVQPRAVFIQSESSEYFHPDKPKASSYADFYNEKRFLSLDLTYGHPVDYQMYEYLLDNGMTRDEYHWFANNHQKRHCIMGNDYYKTNEHLVDDDGHITPAGEIFGYYVITHQYFARYGLPVMHTETNVQDVELAPVWLKKEWANVHRLKQDGVPLVGFTWYSLTDQVDWDTALREDNGRVNPLGLYDLDRQIRPVGESYRELIHEWRAILPAQSLGLSLSC